MPYGNEHLNISTHSSIFNLSQFLFSPVCSNGNLVTPSWHYFPCSPLIRRLFPLYQQSYHKDSGCGVGDLMAYHCSFQNISISFTKTPSFDFYITWPYLHWPFRVTEQSLCFSKFLKILAPGSSHFLTLLLS